MGSSPNLLGFCILILLVYNVNWCESISCSCKPHERNALLNFQKSHMPKYSSSNRLESWSGDDCCTWEGVGCSNLTCHVVSLNLGVDRHYRLYDLLDAAPTMYDILTSTLTQLRNLEYLDLSGNLLSRRSDDTPNEFNGNVMMNQLRYLDLSDTGLEGLIPHQLGNLTNLQVLDLSYTGFLYDLKGFRWVFGLRKLRSLNINFVHLSLVPTNSILELHRLSTLQELQLSYCQLPQHQFLQFMSNSTFLSTSSLKVLDLSFNYLGGSIPHTLSNLSSLQYLSLNDNNFNSTVPSFLGSMRSLQYLYLSDNEFSRVEGGIFGLIEGICGCKYLNLSYNNLQGSITSRPLNFSRCSKYDLEFLDLAHNRIRGGIEWLGNFSALKEINLNSNSFFGNFPESIIKLSFLNSLSLSNNQFSGTVPTVLGKLSSLTILDLSDNNFTGTIPSTLGQLSSLTFLHLSNNNFTGTIPSALGQLSSLISLNLSINHFNGTILSTLVQLSSLSSLDLSNNNFAGTIPSTLGRLSSLSTLLLSNNNFTGTIPSTLGQLSFLQNLEMSKNKLTGVLPDHSDRYWLYLEYLDLSYNHLNGTIPMSLCYSQLLKRVDMKSNRFSGQIPDCSSRNITVDWKVVDLSSNSLSGRVPSFLWELPRIHLLNLSNNTLKGELPITISQSLQILDLGENDFYGKIPSWNLSSVAYPNDSLKILRLRSNYLAGMVPSQMCLFYKLQIIDLANNLLTGPIPKCFGNLSGMRSAIEYKTGAFNFSSKFMSSTEVIKGIEREYTNTLQYLVNLDLSRNNFSGSIPVQLTELQGLIGLNVSHNQLTGKIPSQIGRMKSMESLDLSDNNLQGSIPQGLADLTSLSSLNLSYNKLHGPIPTGSQLSTFTDPSIYAGNVKLCRDMLPKKCSTVHEKNPIKMALDEDRDGNDPYEKLWFPTFTVLGTVIGFWGVIGILNVKKGWKYAYLKLGEEVADWIYVRWMVKKLK